MAPWGIDLGTYCMQKECSTTELQRHHINRSQKYENNSFTLMQVKIVLFSTTFKKSEARFRKTQFFLI